ncbi:hypothetical protein ABZU25_13650 [Micromonospora sp. NPDC005215]|uniref:hypothetical protein n=1 Tax=Micromonospora sp. NPDC005215 TaxID=3157024 RepID=UPI0033A2B7FA
MNDSPEPSGSAGSGDEAGTTTEQPTAQLDPSSATEGPRIPAPRLPEPQSGPAPRASRDDDRPDAQAGRSKDAEPGRRADEQVAEKARGGFDAESTEGKKPSAPGAADDGDRADYDPDEQKQRERFQQNQSRAGRGAAASGADARAFYYDQRVYHVSHGGRKFTVQYGFFGAQYVAAQVDTYVPVPNFSKMKDTLEARHLERLCGDVGSGRRTTAVNLLYEVGCLPDRIGTVEVDDDLIFSVLAEDCVMEAGDGLIIDRGGRTMRDGAVDALRRQARDAGAFIVILDDEDSAMAEATFAHGHADYQQVLERHLRTRAGVGRLAGQTEGSTPPDPVRFAAVAQHAAVARRIRLATSVFYVVRLAEFLEGYLDEVPDGDAVGDLEQALTEWDNQSRKLAKKILAATQDTDETQPAPHRQAFRIAYAVFAGHPLSNVFLAGELLSQQIMPLYETRETPPDRLIFDGNVDNLIHPSMVASARDDSQRAGPRCAELTDDTLITAILDVAWHDYDTLRGPLMTWLTVLAGNRSWQVRLRAAQIAGILAGFDFEQVYRSLIVVWARWQARYRRSAALAMDMAYVDGHLTRRVRQRVQDWTRSPDPLLQDTAARVYGMRLGEDDVPRALRELARMGRQPELTASSSVAAAMSELFLHGAAGQVMDELATWIASSNEHLPQHAVRSLVILAQQPSSMDRRGWLALPELAEHRRRWQRALVTLWRNALTNAETSRRAWNPMRKWLLAADHDDDLRALVEALAMEIFADPLDSRARFNLRLWRNRHPDAVLIAALLHHLTPDPMQGATDGEH